VPFENLSIHLAEPISLDERDLIDKIVRRRRGGFCYELNGQQTSPLSHFTRSTICSRLTPGGRVSISGRTLNQTQGGTRTEQQLDTDDALLAAYRDHFGIVLCRVPDDPAAYPRSRPEVQRATTRPHFLRNAASTAC
jgi:arylamine N-acetyltransferase